VFDAQQKELMVVVVITIILSIAKHLLIFKVAPILSNLESFVKCFCQFISILPFLNPIIFL